MNAIVKTFKNGNNITVIERAKQIKRTLGVQVAAKYLRKHSFSVEGAMYILCNK